MSCLRVLFAVIFPPISVIDKGCGSFIIVFILTLLYGAQIFLASMHQISSIFLVTSAIYFLYLNSNTN